MLTNASNMGKPERKEFILRYFAENEVMLPTGLLYENLDRYRNLTFSKSTVKRLVYELEDDGFLGRVDRGDGWYHITDEGRAYLDGEIDAARDD